MTLRATALFAALPLTLLLANCARDPVSGRANFVTMSDSREIQVSRQELVRRYPPRTAVVFRGKNAYLVGGQARSDAALWPVLPLMDATIVSFHALSDMERNSVRPFRARITNAPAGPTFADSARTSPLIKNALAQFSLSNGLYPNGEPVSGQPLKIIE
jgi:predicted Zn-dependent protease